MIAPHQMALAAGSDVLFSELFSGTLGAGDVVAHPAGGLVAAGDRLTELQVFFNPTSLATDLNFQPASRDVDFRQVNYVYDQSACSEPSGVDAGDAQVGDAQVGDAQVGDAQPIGAEPIGAEPVGREPTVSGGGGCSASPGGWAPWPTSALGLAGSFLALVTRARRSTRTRVR